MNDSNASNHNTMPVYLDLNNDSDSYKKGDADEKAKCRARYYGIIRSSVEHRIDEIAERMILRPNTGITSTGAFNNFWREACDLYSYGHFYACVAYVGMTAEKICKDLIITQKFELNGVELGERQKDALRKQNFSQLINTLFEINLIDEDTKKLLHRIREKRNSYVHVKQALQPNEDSYAMLELLRDVIVKIHSVFNHYTIVQGALVPKPKQ